MPKYFDPITPGNIDIDVNAGTILYLVKVGKDYSIKGISSGLDQLASDPHTHAKLYWLIDPVSTFLAKVTEANMESLIFPEGTLTTAPLTLETVKALGIDPVKKIAAWFSWEVGEQLNHEAVNDRSLTADLLGMMKTYFTGCITPENQQALSDAWSELQQSGSVTSGSGSAAIVQLNIPPADQARMVLTLTTGYLSYNGQNRSYIESQFAFSVRYPTHFERFAHQVNFGQILENARRNQDSSDGYNIFLRLSNPNPPVQEPVQQNDPLLLTPLRNTNPNQSGERVVPNAPLRRTYAIHPFHLLNLHALNNVYAEEDVPGQWLQNVILQQNVTQPVTPPLQNINPVVETPVTPQQQRQLNRENQATLRPRYSVRLFSEVDPLDSLTSERLEQELVDCFRDHFRQQITIDNYYDIEVAWQEFQTSGVNTPVGLTAFNQLDLSVEAQNRFTRDIDRRYDDLTNVLRADIRDAFYLDDLVPVHVYRYGERAGLTEILVEKRNEFFPSTQLV